MGCPGGLSTGSRTCASTPTAAAYYNIYLIFNTTAGSPPTRAPAPAAYYSIYYCIYLIFKHETKATDEPGRLSTGAPPAARAAAPPPPCGGEF